MTIQSQNTKSKFNLEERTAIFGQNIILFCKSIKPDYIDKVLITQLVRSGTSIGANYMEANGCDSKKDFKSKIGICKKEAKETTHWLRILSVTIPKRKTELRQLWKEAHELALIFGAINKNS